MGQKVHPFVLRVGFTRTWLSRWYADPKDYPRFINEDYKMRKIIKTQFKPAAISKVIIERMAEQVRVRIFCARPGLIIGRHGADIERLRGELSGLAKRDVNVDIHEVSSPGLDAQLVSENVALQLEKRIGHRRAIKRCIEQAKNAGAEGIKISCSGRLGGAEMSREETYKEGKIPLSTLRADIEYGFSESLTTYGLIGIKVWIYKGEILGKIKPEILMAPPQKSRQQ